MSKELKLKCQDSRHQFLELFCYKNNAEICLTGLVYMSETTLQCNLNKADALKLADAIYAHFNKDNQ